LIKIMSKKNCCHGTIGSSLRNTFEILICCTITPNKDPVKNKKSFST
jgi:hypothetical protein